MNTTVNSKAIELVNAAVSKVAEARRRYGHDYVEQSLIPNHEKVLAGIFDWRDQQLARVGGFSAATAAQTAAAQAKAVYNATVAQLKLQNNDALKSLKAQYDQVVAQINTQIKTADKAKDKVTSAQLKSYLTQAKNVYNAAVASQNNSYKQGLAAAKAQMSQPLTTAAFDPSTLLVNPTGTSGMATPAPAPGTAGTVTVTNPSTGGSYTLPAKPSNGQQVVNPDGTILQYNQSTNQWGFITPTTTTTTTAAPATSLSTGMIQLTNSATGTVYALPASPVNGQQVVNPDGSTLQYNAASNQWAYLTQPTSTQINSGGYPPASQAYYQPSYSPTDQSTAGPSVPSTQPVGDIPDGTQITGPDGSVYQYDAVTSNWYVIQPPSGSDQLDVFSTTDWSGGWGSYSTMTDRINRMGVVPNSAVGGFGQWAALAGALINTAAGIGQSVATLEIQKAIMPGQVTAKAPAAAPAAPTPSTNYTPWIIGGVAVGALVLIMVMRKGKKK